MEDQQTASQLDVAAILESIRDEVRLQRQMMSGGSGDELAFPEIELRQTLQEIEASRVVSAHWPLAGQGPLQRGIAFVNKVVRRYLRWYINPIVEQQNGYNEVVARTLQGLVAANEELRGEVAQLRARVVELEQRAHGGREA